jgi:hypothetical protein
MSTLDNALQRALSIRLNLQIGLSSLPFVEESMDIHLDRWLEHVPMPPEMPDGHLVSYLAMFGSDAQRVWWGAWGDPRGFVPKMADYFKLCNMAKSDEAIIDQIGLTLEPKLVGSWIGVWGGKVVTGWHIWDPQDWEKFAPMIGNHEAKAQIKTWVETHQVARVERFSQSIGEAPFSEFELRIPGASVDEQVRRLDDAFLHFTGARLEPGIVDRLREAQTPDFAAVARIRAGKLVKFAAIVPGVPAASLAALCGDLNVGFDPKIIRLIGPLSGEHTARLEYGRAGGHAGLDVFVEPQLVDKPGADKPARSSN